MIPPPNWREQVILEQAITEQLRFDLAAMERRAALAESKLALLDSPALLEALASWEHDEHWGKSLRYAEQNNVYREFVDAQRESDREEVRHYLAVIREFMERGGKGE